MGSRPEYEEARLIESLRHALRAPLMYVTLDFRVERRSEDKESVELDRVVRDLRLLVNRLTGERILFTAEEADADLDLAELVASDECDVVPVEFTVHEKQLRLVLDLEHRVIGAFGGAGGGKTHVNAMWVFRQWMVKGGAGARGWWVSPSREQTSIGVDKLFRGEDELPPIFPPELVIQYPEKITETDQNAYLVDGSRIQFRNASSNSKGGKLKGFGVRFIAIDEVCEIRDVAQWRIIRDRVGRGVGGHQGQVFMSSTPMPGHWAYTEVVLRVDAGKKKGYTYDHLSKPDNVWIPWSEIEDSIRDAGGPDDPICRREVFGEWIFAGARLWHRFDTKKHVQEGTPDQLGWRVVNRSVAGEHWPGLKYDATRGLGGQDFNMYPMTTVIAQICVPKGEKDVGTNRIVYFTREVVTKNEGTALHGLRLSAEGFHELPIVCDPSGDQPGHRLQMHLDQSAHEADDLREAGHAVIPAEFNDEGVAVMPPQISSIRVVHELMLKGRFAVSASCTTLVQALSTQTATPRGTIDKKPGTASDRISSPTDAMRYLLWKLFNHEITTRTPTRYDEDDEYELANAA